MTMENIVTLVTQTATHSSGEILLGFEGTWYGIRSPFKGAFMLNVAQDITAYGTDIVKVDNIYGEARTLYVGANAVTAAALPVGLYMLSFDTNTRKLYLVGNVSQGQQPTPQTPQTGIRLLNYDIALSVGDNEVLHIAIPTGKVLVMAQVQFGGTSGTRTSITAWLCDDGKPETVFSSAEHTATDAVTMYLSAIINNETQNEMEVFLKAYVSASGYSAKASTTNVGKPYCTKIEWVKL